MKNKVLLGVGTIGAAAIMALAFAPSWVSAQGAGSGEGYHHGSEQSLERKAAALGMDTEQLRSQLQDKTMLQIAEEQGLDHEQLQERMQASARERWQEMGLSAEEIAQRETRMAEHQANCDGTAGDRHQYGRQ